ncbi:hypothetical protein NC651_024964 [Populus alba x Populus x berolinensis]|nr:hypothetical protein NC651_024964 [Populus alba x Populus x berolinensis]
MQRQGLILDTFSLSSAVSACGDVGLLQLGHQIHGYAIKQCFLGEFVKNAQICMYSRCEKDLCIETALTDMYAKSGDLQTAEGDFRSMSEKSVVSWSTMISGHEMHGCIDAAITIFNQMDFGIEPDSEHFACTVDLWSHPGDISGA